MHLLATYLFMFGLALGAACGSGKPENQQEISSTPEETLPATDTLYRISGTEPFWSFLVAKPQMIFTSMEGDTLFFPYQEPRQHAARQEGYLQVYELGDQQKLILQQANQCPCSDGMSDQEYPYRAVLVLQDNVLDGCGRR